MENVAHNGGASQPVLLRAFAPATLLAGAFLIFVKKVLLN